MKQTSNYQLNQWEMTDRIQMEDFNRDNEKVDAALAATAQQAALAGTQLIATVTVESEVNYLTLPLSDIDWDAYSMVYLFYHADLYSTSDKQTFDLGNQRLFSTAGSSIVANAPPLEFILQLFPFFSKYHIVQYSLIASTVEKQEGIFTIPYSQLPSATLSSFSNPIKAGSKIEIWATK